MKRRISVRPRQFYLERNLAHLTKHRIASEMDEKHPENVTLGVTAKLVSNLEKIFPAHHPIQKELPLTEARAVAQNAECKLNIVLLSLWGLMHKIYPASRY